MVDEKQVALMFLAYLVFPLLLFLLWWFVGFFRRKVLKKGGDAEGAGEGEA